WWRHWACPRTTEEAAHDFFTKRNDDRVRVVLADPDSWYDFYLTDFKRRIAYIYGLASNYNVRTTGKWSAGWNRWLIAEAGLDPEQAAELILRRVCELARFHRDRSPRSADP